MIDNDRLWWLGPVAFFGMCLIAVILHNVIVAPCRATTHWHTVTNHLGTYKTTYKDNGRWCLWVRDWS
jgi:hypothetical protein